MMEAVILVGVQGAGKSTFYRQRFFDTHVRINLDMLRTRRRERSLFAACLETGQSFVIDNTNPKASDRARYIRPARERGFLVVAYVFEVELRDAIRRNNQRESKQKIPANAVASTFRKLEFPTASEGFDRIFLVSVTETNQFAITKTFEAAPNEEHQP
jgi:predicted kinase